ncbi:MAG: DUF429 domain-containing protein [Planctomycetota bacterium]
MQLLGIDFTSAPRRAKPIVCARGELKGDRLACNELLAWDSFAPFDAFLAAPGPWIAAVDFPLGQPRRLVQALGWPEDWEAYIAEVAKLDKQAFCALLTDYCAGQPVGDKHHLRETDTLAKSCSPMMLYGVPVGKMFFEGAARVLQSGATIMPCHAGDPNRTVIEGYPALVTRHLARHLPHNSARQSGKSPPKYKNDQADSDQRRQARERLLKQCQSSTALAAYGVKLSLATKLKRQIVDDATGDSLDAVFCLIQAAAWHLNPAIIPTDADPVEGWIADPTLGLTLGND